MNILRFWCLLFGHRWYHYRVSRRMRMEWGLPTARCLRCGEESHE